MEINHETAVADKEFPSQWRIPDLLWSQIEPLLPEHKRPHPLGCHRKRVDNRAAMNAIFFVLRTGCQWNALNATRTCSDLLQQFRAPTLSRMGRSRRLLVRWEKRAETYLAMLYFACALITCQRSGLLG